MKWKAAVDLQMESSAACPKMSYDVHRRQRMGRMTGCVLKCPKGGENRGGLPLPIKKSHYVFYVNRANRD